MQIAQPVHITSLSLSKKGFFPNNARLPLVVYKNVLNTKKPQEIVEIFQKNHWIKSWINGIYPYHHYHSNTHEVLGVHTGTCLVQVGGDQDTFIFLEEGDVMIIPAGVAHKNIEASDDFVCVGAYPFDLDYDMYYGDADDVLIADNITSLPLPESDPVYGINGVLFNYWK